MLSYLFMPNRKELNDCRFCGIDNFDLSNFAAAINGEIRHKKHSTVSRAPTIEEFKEYYELTTRLRKQENIYPNPETPRDLKSNIAFATYISSEGLQKFVSISEPDLLEDIKQFKDYNLILGKDIFNFDNITIQGYLSNALLESPGFKSENKFTHKKNELNRWHDTEFKILEFLTIQLLGPDNQEIKALIKEGNFDEIHKLSNKFDGILKIFSERRVCESCAKVDQLFQKIFPNIVVDIIEGAGDHVDHGPDGPIIPKTQAGICKLRREIAGMTVTSQSQLQELIIA
jgi:hypothetical protein